MRNPLARCAGAKVAELALARSRHTELAQAVNQRAPRNAERFGGAGLVASGLLERIQNALPLDALQFIASARQDVLPGAVEAGRR